MAAIDIGEDSSLLVVGMARSGVAAALAARRVLAGARIVIADRDGKPSGIDQAPKLREAGIAVEPGRQDNALLDGCDLIIKSPGVPGQISLLSEAHLRGIPVIGEVEFAWRYLDNITVGVTGTNGKTTTTELIGHILRSSGRKAAVSGNVGTPLSSLVGRVDMDTVLVVELSSFQLEDSIDFRPDVGVLLNLTEDHLDRHRDIEHYFSSKLMIFANQGGDDVAVLNLDDPNSKRPLPGHGRQLWFSRREPGERQGRTQKVFVRDGVICADLDAVSETSSGLRGRVPWEIQGYEWQGGRKGPEGGEDAQEGGCREVIAWSDAGLRGEHNLENALAATAACLSLGLTTGEVAAGISGFPGVVHRLQDVAVIDGVTYVNDSKATNVDAAIKALTAFESGLHLILGGSGKGCSFDELARAASGGKVRQVILIGESAPEIEESFRKAGRDTIRAGRLDKAVAAARDGAEPGDTVLLSPACASFDQYRNYEERGEHFARIVSELAEGGN